MEEKIIIVPKARPAVDFASNLLVIPKDDFDKYVNEIDKHHVELIRSLEMSWAVTADGRAMEAAKMVKEKYEEIIAEKDKEIALLTDKANYNEYAYKNKKQELADTCRFYEAELRHHKYKRCLDKAKWCEAEVHNIRRTPLCDMDEHEGWQHDDEFWQRWHKRWIKIAEQFKEAK